MTNMDRFTEKPDHNVTGGVRSRRKSFKNELMALPSSGSWINMEISNFVSAGAASEFGRGTCGGSK